ncbi:hypothetical protein [Bifidobacterium oedipodis]|uniref:Lipoprotein n=1 Tax=Bifidobacterium oedipodis TaxID=2675322 RepID=A0A7Y0HRD8_9BIFI|nr:hypothetical protein [Bifidobacterium sp. DSM 109957]NMM93945.1 hypothetical protein [Bifidobacterium sp. DSM 109957]
MSKARIIAMCAVAACLLPLAGCDTGPQGDLSGEMATGTVCIGGQKFAIAYLDGYAPQSLRMEPLNKECEVKE